MGLFLDSGVALQWRISTRALPAPWARKNLSFIIYHLHG